MCLWLKGLTVRELQRHRCAHENSQSSGPQCHLFAGLFQIFSLPPVHRNTKHILDSTIFSKTTLYTEHLFQYLRSRQAALSNSSRTSISRVAGTRATPLPQGVSPKSFNFWKFPGRHLSIIRAQREFGERSTSSIY